MKNYAMKHLSPPALNCRQLRLAASEWFFKRSCM